MFTCVIIFPVLASAQASIAGVVRDTSGAVMPGVTVEAASPALIERVRSVVTDGSGQYRVENLRPGAYTVTFTLPGFATVRREGIELTGTFVATVNVDLRVGSLEETVTVTGESPAVDVQSTLRQRVMDHEVLDALPVGRTDRELIVLIPGTSSDRQDVGGSSTTITGRATIHGSKGTDQRIAMGGLSIGGPRDGASSSHGSNFAAYQEVTIDTAAVDAEQATGGVRVNYIPKDGGNTFSGTFLGSIATEGLQSNNYTQDLSDRGLRTPDRIKSITDINPGFGGPLKKDRLWFFVAARFNTASQYPAGIFFNRNANNPNAWTYEPDESRRPSVDSNWKDGTAHLTWQATPKNKLGLLWSQQVSCYCPELISATMAPETAINRILKPMRSVLADWTSPLTNRVLLEAGFLYRNETPTRYVPDPATNLLMIAVTDQALGNLTYRASPGIQRNVVLKHRFFRAAASYITGAHAFKAGITDGPMTEAGSNRHATQPLAYRFNNGVPNQITLYATPYSHSLRMDSTTGIYAQGRTTLDRLTVSYGVRYDRYKTSFPETYLGPAPLVPTRDVTLPATPGESWHDITPKSGASYDLFGNGKTALKVSLNKYLEGIGFQSPLILGEGMAPVNRLVTSTTRVWNDANRNYVPECDLLNAAANGECLQMANRNFGTLVPGASYDPNLLTGWGKRGYNWEFSAGVQHEVVPRVAVDVSYFRRWYGNFIVTDNRAVGPSDFDSFSITAPSHAQLPGGGSYTVSGLYDLKPARFGVPADNYITSASNYGKQTEHWNGFDVTVNARPRAGALLQGGLSAGRTSTNNCEVVAQLPEILFGMTAFGAANASSWMPSEFCEVQENLRTQVKFVGSYTIPRIDVQASAVFRNQPGPLVLANYNVANAAAASSLGRSLSGGAANVTVNLVDPGTMYGDRMNQLDLRFGKILRLGRTRMAASVDLYNALNGNAVLAHNNAFATWLRPQSILLARFVKVGVQLDF
jgi:hypothetical protein